MNNKKTKEVIEQVKTIVRVFLLFLVFLICLMIGYDTISTPMVGNKFATIAIVFVAWILTSFGIYRILRPKSLLFL